jgi:hypothetical protein
VIVGKDFFGEFPLQPDCMTGPASAMSLVAVDDSLSLLLDEFTSSSFEFGWDKLLIRSAILTILIPSAGLPQFESYYQGWAGCPGPLAGLVGLRKLCCNWGLPFASAADGRGLLQLEEEEWTVV